MESSRCDVRPHGPLFHEVWCESPIITFEFFFVGWEICENMHTLTNTACTAQNYYFFEMWCSMLVLVWYVCTHVLLYKQFFNRSKWWQKIPWMLEFGTFFLCVCVWCVTLHKQKDIQFRLSASGWWLRYTFQPKKSEKLSESLKNAYIILCVCVWFISELQLWFGRLYDCSMSKP